MVRIIALLLYLPHLVLFYFSENKTVLIADLYSRGETMENNKFKIAIDLTGRLFHDRFFRNLFYFRTSGFISKILRLFYPQDRYFTIDIHTKLGKGVKLAHPYSTILNAETIGDNLYVNHLVTIGEKNGEKPVIGNNVQLHAGATVIGGIVLGDNVVVGAGAVVVKNVPANSIVVGNPAYIISADV